MARVALSILLLASVACAREPAPHADRSVAFGWLHGPCLAIRRGDLAKGTPVAAVIVGEPQRVEEARVGDRTDSPQRCPALTPGRAKVNAKPGVFFYALDSGAIGPSDMGVALVNAPARPVVVDGLARVDVDGDGRPDVFSACATTEGIKFGVWTERAYQGEPRWSAYYYLDYDTRPTCP